MLGAKEAAKVAREHANDLFDPEELKYLRVEEIDLASDEQQWRVTLGWVESARTNPGAMAAMHSGGSQPLPRVYKVFVIDAESGDLLGLDMRK